MRAVVYGGLRDIESKDRAVLFLKVIPNAKDLSLLCDVVSTMAGWVRKSPEDRSQSVQVTFGDDADEVRKALVRKVKEFATARKIWEQAQPDRILMFWWGSTFTNEVKDFTDDEFGFPDGIRSMLQITVQMVRSTAGNYEYVSRHWAELIDIERLATIARDWIAGSTISDDDRELAKRYVAAFEKETRFS